MSRPKRQGDYDQVALRASAMKTFWLRHQAAFALRRIGFFLKLMPSPSKKRQTVAYPTSMPRLRKASLTSIKVISGTSLICCNNHSRSSMSFDLRSPPLREGLIASRLPPSLRPFHDAAGRHTKNIRYTAAGRTFFDLFDHPGSQIFRIRSRHSSWPPFQQDS